MSASKSNYRLFEGRRFLVSAILASIVLLFAEQSFIVTRSPVYFFNTGEFLWNVFVSTSFLNLIVTLYGLTGGICLQVVADLVDPFGLVKKWWIEARTDPFSDQRSSAKLPAAILAAGTYGIATILIQMHVSTAYNNKMLAAVLMLAILIFLILPTLVVYSLTKQLIEHAAGYIERILPRRVLLIETVLFAFLFLFLLLVFFLKNPYILNAIDFSPFAALFSYFTVQVVFYMLLGHPHILRAFESPFFKLAALSWVLVVAIMTSITVNDYSKFPNVASILANHSVFSKPVIRTIQHLGDKDKDGFSAILNGGDCNDNDANINPLARDIPENGIDEDCVNGDLQYISSKYKIKSTDSVKQKIKALQSDYNIILISIDALRVDHLGYMGYQRNTSPELDSFAAESMVFTRAYSQAPNTPQSIPSFITGVYPSQISWDKYANFPKIMSKTRTMPEILKDNGYFVGGVFSHWFFKRRNLERNSDFWDASAFKERGHSENVSTDDLITDNAIAHLKKMKSDNQPVFLWLHYFDPHFLYTPHKGINFGKTQLDLYDSEIRFSSKQVGRFLDYYKQTPYYKNSVIFILADHGEEFGENGHKWHGSNLYEEAIRVPLIVHSPKLPTGVFDKPVEIVDVAATVVDLVGIDKEKTEFQGDSLLPMILEPQSVKHTIAYSEKLKAPTFPWSIQAIITEDYKLLYRLNDQAFELYNLKEDPEEKRNLFGKLPQKSDEMVELFTQYKEFVVNRQKH